MKLLYIFNPDSDLALANNDPNFMAPKSARKLASDLALLPIWFASSESVVLIQSKVDLDYLIQLQTLFDLPVTAALETELSNFGELRLVPWGWNREIVNRFRKMEDVNVDYLSENQISEIRKMSSRRWVSKILNQFTPNNLICGASYVLNTIEELERIDTQLHRFLLKAPLSGSGRGLKWCRSGLDEAGRKWFKNTIRQQECVIAEPIYNRVLDFAMEFRITSSVEIEFIGYSYFKTDNNGVYQGNILMDDLSFSTFLNDQFFRDNFIEEICDELKVILLQTYGSTYVGPLGVDMMVCQENEGEPYLLHPCVEVNLRMNMGILAHTFYTRFVSESAKGEYGVDFYKTEGEVAQRDSEWKIKYPLVIQEGKIQSGYLSLAAVTPKSQCHSWILIE